MGGGVGEGVKGLDRLRLNHKFISIYSYFPIVGMKQKVIWWCSNAWWKYLLFRRTDPSQRLKMSKGLKVSLNSTPCLSPIFNFFLLGTLQTRWFFIASSRTLFKVQNSPRIVFTDWLCRICHAGYNIIYSLALALATTGWGGWARQCSGDHRLRRL